MAPIDNSLYKKHLETTYQVSGNVLMLYKYKLIILTLQSIFCQYQRRLFDSQKSSNLLNVAHLEGDRIKILIQAAGSRVTCFPITLCNFHGFKKDQSLVNASKDRFPFIKNKGAFGFCSKRSRSSMKTKNSGQNAWSSYLTTLESK